MAEKVVVGLSGGVDSAVTAYLLKQQGYDVIGVTMQIWKEDIPENGDTGVTAVEDAKKVAEHIGIPHYVLNFKETFHEKVISYFIQSYNIGKTPNPCIVCNRYVKWEALLEKAKELGAEYIATGHYAEVVKTDRGRYTVKNSKTAKKDQTYALYMLTQEQLAHTIMPLGKYEKDEIRQIAIDAGIPVANKPDSQDICFVEDGKYANFIRRETKKWPRRGDFVDTEGNVVGQHRGIIYYTVGQRKGLDLNLGYPAYVAKIDAKTNQIVVSDNQALFKDTVIAENVNMMAAADLSNPTEAFAKIRYNHTGADCRVWMEDDRLVCKFYEPQRAVTPGQALVVYKDGVVLCGGEIVAGEARSENTPSAQ